VGLWNEIKKLGRKIDDKILQPVKNSIKNIGKNPLNAILTIAAVATNNAWALPYINAGTALAAGADPKDVLKAAAASWVASYVTSGVIKSDIAKTLIGDSKLIENIATGGIRGGLTAALQGKDFGEGVITGVINQGVAYGMQQVAGYTSAQLKEKFPDFITSAKELGFNFLSDDGGIKSVNVYREDDGSKFFYDNNGNILGGVDTEGNSIIGNKGTYVVVDADNQGVTIKNLAGEVIGGQRAGTGVNIGDLSDFPDTAKVDIIQDQKDGQLFPNRLPLQQRLELQKQQYEAQYGPNPDPELAQQLYEQINGIGRYAPPAEVVQENEVYRGGIRSEENKYIRNQDGTISVIDRSTGLGRGQITNNAYIQQLDGGYVDAPQTPIAPGAPDSQYEQQDLQEGAQPPEVTGPMPAPVAPTAPDSQYVQQDQQEGPVAPEISGPMPAPVTPVGTTPVAPTAPGAPLGTGIKLPTAPVATAPVAPTAPTGDRTLVGGPAWARDYQVIERANGQVDFIDRATGQITGGFNSRVEPELRAQFEYAEPTPAPPTGLLTDLTKPVEIGEPVTDTGPTGPTTITPIPPGATEPVGEPTIIPPAPVVPVDLVPQPPLGGGLKPGAGGETGVLPGAGGETGITAPPPPPPAPAPIDTTLPPISLLPPTGAPSIGDGALGTGLIPGTGGQTGITPGAGGETGLVIPTPPPQLQPITTTPTPEQPLGPITPVQETPVAPPPTTPQDPPIPQQNQFPSADKWLEALQRYLTNTAISAATRGIVGGLVQQAQRLVSGGPSPVTPPSGPGTPSIPGAPSTGGTDLSWLGGLLGGSAAAGLTTTAARAAPVTYGQQRVSYEEAPEAPAFESGSAILDRDPSRTFLG